MATSTLNNMQIFDPLSLTTGTESAAIVVPAEALELWICADFPVHLRLKTTENGFRVPANWQMNISVSTLRNKSIYVRNDSGSTAAVSIMFVNRTSP